MKRKKIGTTGKMTLSAMFIALGMVLPFLTGQIQQFGNMLLPMHLPVFLCGMICGWQYGAVIGFIIPLLRSVIFSMPPLYPTAVAMAFELMSYGLVSGIMYGHLRMKNALSVYISLISAMIAGRVVWGVVQIILLGFAGNSFTWKMFMAGAFINAVPGIALQVILIPAIIILLNRAGLTVSPVAEE